MAQLVAAAAPVTISRPRKQIAWAGYILAAVLIVYAFVTPLVVSSSAMVVQPARRFWPPLGETLLGTDHLGRDLTLLVAVGLRTSILIALCVVLLAGAIGWVLGAMAGYFGGVADNVIGRTMDVFNAFPALILAIALVAAIGPSFSSVVVVLTVATWANYGRVIRARVLSLKAEEFVAAARLFGVSDPTIIGRHIWPNTIDLFLAIALLQVPNVMLAESTISFLGFGLQNPSVSLGLIIASEKDYLQTNPFPVVLSGVVLVMICASVSAVGLDLRRRAR
jgi:peptide/nickel transport system permease protein